MLGSKYYDSNSEIEYPNKDFNYDDRDSLMGHKRKAVPKPYSLNPLTLPVIFIVCVFAFILIFNKRDITPASKNLRSTSYIDGKYRIIIIADLDKKSKVEEDKKGKWKSIAKKGLLTPHANGTFSIDWVGDSEYTTKIAEAGRGMELSALLEYNDRLYAFDDRTGLVFELRGGKAIPRHILMEGDGNTDKGQKTEWATVKDGKMYVGSFGKEYTNPDGSIKNTNNMWVSVIDHRGVITRENWTDRFNKVREAAGCPYPGYMIHEAITWSPHRKQWVILPRRVSKEAYDENLDEKRGSNTVILASEDFSKIEVKHITPLTPTRGFSEFKFLPGSRDSIIVALKSEENEEQGTQNSYITVFDLDGKILMEETEIPGGMKFEGLEFFGF